MVMLSSNRIECLLLTFLLGICFFTSYAQSQNASQPEVTILQGTLRGLYLTSSHNRSFSGYIGIPYGQPPIGNLRFAKPVAADGWNGTRNATVDANVCPQSVTSADEDCLYLNVYTPQLSESANSSLIPVMVYIHGGGLSMGSGSYSVRGPEYYLNKDVVLVTLNYRLSTLGFLSTGDEVAPGNWGFKDQVLALQWVQNNIQFFGGDPDRVTIFGGSAGAISVHLLAMSDATIGLFHRYITQSGSALGPMFYEPRATFARRAFELGENVGCSNDTSDALISCLRTIDLSLLVGASVRSLGWGTYYTDEPDIEGAILTDSAENLIANGKLRDLPRIVGVCRDEELVSTIDYYINETQFQSYLDNIDSELASLLQYPTNITDSDLAWIAAVKAFYFNDLTANTSVLIANATNFRTDRKFNYPTFKAAVQQLGATTQPQYFYRLEYRGTYGLADYSSNVSTVQYGVGHGDDLLYFFTQKYTANPIDDLMSEADLYVSDSMVELWTSFATNGIPTASALNGTTWEPFSTEEAYLRIGNNADTAIEVQYSFLKERMEFWASLEDPVTGASTASNGSVGVTSSTNFVILLLACLSAILLAATGDRLG